MFADSMDDVMDELWGALQAAGAARQAVVSLAGAMAARDAELEQVMQARIAAAEANTARARAAQKEAEDKHEADRIKWQAQMLQVQAHTRHLENNMGLLTEQLKEKEKLASQIDVLKATHQAAMALMEDRMKVGGCLQSLAVTGSGNHVHAGRDTGLSEACSVMQQLLAWGHAAGCCGLCI